MAWIIFMLAGVLAGTVAGLFGVGGGLIIVPILLWVFDWQQISSAISMHMAIGTSLMTICFTSLSSMYAHHQHGHVDWYRFRQLIFTLLLGSFSGAVLAASIATVNLKLIFAIFVLIMAIRIWLPSVNKRATILNHPFFVAFYGYLTGVISAIVGIGGGTLIVPYLVMAGEQVKKAVGTSAACGFPIALSGALGFMLMGHEKVATTLPWQTGFVNWQAFLGIVSTSLIFARFGAKLAKALPAELLRKLFSLLLFIISITFFLNR